MPLVRIELKKGKTKEYKKELLVCIHEALVEAIQIEDWDRFQRIIEIDPLDFETSAAKTDNFMIIELTLFPGRTTKQKKAIIEKITAKLHSRLGIEPTDIFIVIHEPSLENWGMGGRQLSDTKDKE